MEVSFEFLVGEMNAIFGRLSDNQEAIKVIKPKFEVVKKEFRVSPTRSILGDG